MKYGESLFDILYLLFAIISGVLILNKADRKLERYMGIATLILGIGDAFHLVPRVFNYFIEADLNAYLGVGKLITSITMTVFYVFMYHIWLEVYDEKSRACGPPDCLSAGCRQDHPLSFSAERLAAE